MFNFYKKESRWLRGIPIAIAMSLVSSIWSYAATYYSKAAATDFTATASWGANADGSGAAPGSISNADDFIIQNGSAMNLNAGSAAVRTLTINAGSLTVGSNTLTVSLAGVDICTSNLTVNTGGTLNVSGTGNIIINGQFQVLGTATLNQTGGLISVDGNGNAVGGNSVAGSIVNFTSNVLTLSGGTLRIVDPHQGAGLAFQLNNGTAIGILASGTHTLECGDGTSTQAGGNATNGLRFNTWTGSARIHWNNFTVNGAAGTNRHVTSVYGFGINGNLVVNSGGELRMATVYVARDLTVNASGTLTTTTLMGFGASSGTSVPSGPSTFAQTVSGAGLFRNLTASPTANFTALTFNNSNASGVTFSGANSLLSGTNTGTASGTVTFTNGIANLGGNTFVMGIGVASTNAFSGLTGGFAPGSTVRRWMTATFLPTSLSTATPTVPFHTGLQQRHVFMARTGALASAGWIEATHTNVAGLTPDVFADGIYNVQQRTNSSWALTSGGGLGLGAQTLSLSLKGEGLIVTAAAPGAAPRLIQAGAALKTHVAATGTSAAPSANRSGLVLADLAGPHYIGINSADIGFYSIANGNWNAGGTWSKGTAPTATDNPLVSAGNTVTVNSAGNVALSVAVAGTLNITSGDLTVGGASASGISVSSGATLAVNGGTLNLRDGTNNNRRLISNGTLNVSSGNLNIDGNLNVTSTGFFTQSGGTITIDGNGTTTSSAQDLALFQNLPANFNVTAGNLTFVDPPPTALNTVAYDSPTGDAVWGAAHVTTFGNGVSTASGNATNGFRIDSWVNFAYLHMGSFVLNGAAGTNRFLTTAYTNVPFTGDFTVNAGSDARTPALWVGGNLTNNGLLTTTTSLNMANWRYNAGITDVTSAQSISGSGTFGNLLVSPTANVVILRVQNSSAGGITLNTPLTMSGQLQMINGKLNTTSTNLLTMYSATGNVAIGGAATSSYVNGPMERRIPASTAFNTFFATMPVGKTGPNYFTLNASTSAAGTINFRAECFNANAGTFGTSLTTLNANRRWETSISGVGVMTSYAVTIYDGNSVTGNAVAATPAYPGTNFDVVGNGANWTAGVAPLPNTLAMSTNELTGTMPQAFGFGNTGPLNVTLALGTQVTGSVSVNSTNNSVTRLGITAVGSSGTVTLTDLIYTYTGTSAADIAANGVTLWSGTITAPVAQIGLGVSLSGGFATFSGLSVNIASGSTFLWIRMNTTPGATIGNLIDGKVETGNLAFAVSGGATATPPIPAADLDPAGSRLIDYCQAVFTNACTSNDFLSAFSLNTLSSTPGCTGPATTNYAKLVQTTSLQQGNAYTANFTTGSGGAQGVAIWFDFNHDGDFADVGEFFATAGTTAASTAGTLAITIDPAALTGLTRMRVMNRWNTTFVQGDVCLNPINYGTTADYDVTITSPTPRSLDPITSLQVAAGYGISTTNNNLLRVDLPTSGSLGTLTLTQIRFTYTGTSAADIAASGVTLWTGTSSGPVTQIGSAVSLSGGLANFTGLSTALGATNYLWLRVNTSASAVIANLVDAKVVIGDITVVAAGGATSPGSQPTADIDPAGTSFIDYCAPTYASGCGSGDPITNVVLNGATINLANPTGCTANPFYTFYNAVNQPDLYQGSTYSIDVTFGTDGTQWTGVWIDFDQDGQLETTEFFEKTSVTGASGTATFNIVVPITATLGNTRMRVRGGNDAQLLNTQACGVSSSPWGEAEDYIVTIIPPPNCSTLLPFPATAATASPTTVCSGSSVNFGITVPMPAGTGITYQWRRNGVNVGAPVSTPTSSIVVTTGGNYDVVISCNGTPQVTSSVVAVTSLNPTIATTTPASRCGAGSVTLAATGSVGTTIKWYAGPSGGATLASGGSYPTPSLGVGVTPYYAAASQVFGTENGGKAAFTPGTGFVTTGWGVVFTAASDLVLNTVDIYPDGTGDVVVGLYASDATTLIAETPAIPVSGTLTLQTITLGFDVPAGADYRLLIKSYNGITGLGRDAGTFPNSSPSGTLVVTASEWGGTTTGTNYFFYNMNISRSCDSPRSLVNATVTAPPFLGVTTPNNTICSGLTTSGTAFGAGYTTYTWTPALGVSPAGPGTLKTLSPTVTTSYLVTATGGGCNNSANLTIYVKPSPTNPTPVVAVVPGGVCLGASKTLSTTASAGGNLVLSQWTFDDNTLGGWAVSSGGTSPTNWQVVTAPYTYAGQITGFSVTPTASPFIIVNSDILGSGSADGFANIVSPSFSTLGHSSVTLSFDHVYRTTGANISATVQYSTDGGLTWSSDVYFTDVVTPAQTWNSSSIVTTTQVITLPGGAGNQANVKLRFRCDYDWDYYWMVDNIQVYAPATVEYRWSSPFAFAGIPAPAQVYSNANNLITVTPTAGGSINYTVDVRNSQGCFALTPASHSTNVSDVTIAPTNSGPQRVGTTLFISTTATGGFGGYSFQWRKTSGSGSGPTVINPTNSFSYTNAQVTESGTYQVTVQDGQGCSNVLSTDALVYTALVWNGSQGSSWTNPLNWTPPIVPTNDCAENVAITSSGTAPIFPGPSQNIGNFALEEGSTLQLNSNLQVCGSVTGGGLGISTVNGTGNIELTGTGVAFVSGKARLQNLIINKSAGSQVRFTGTTYISDLMTVSNNNAAITVDPSGTVVLESNLTSTAKIGPIPAGTSISVTNPGKFVQKRAIPFVTPNAPGNGQWFFLGSAMAPKPFTDWSDDFHMNGTAGSFATQGSLPEMVIYGEQHHTTLFKYSETDRNPGKLDTVQKRGWRIPTSLDLIALGRGYRTFISRYGSNDEFDNSGTINFGTVSFPSLTSTDVPGCSNTTSDWCYTSDRGFNLVSNPYPCDIDWEASAVAWPKSPSMQNAYYRWVSDLNGYGSYANGGIWTGVVPQPANARYIPSSMGYFVRLNPAGATYNETMTITEAAKSTSTAGTFARTATSTDPMIRLHLTQPSLNGTYGFETVVRFMDAATDAYDFNLDYSAMGSNRFYMTMPVDNQDLAVNSLHTLTESRVVPVRTYFQGTTGDYQLKFSGISTLAPGCGIYLKDNFLGLIHDVNAVSTYTFNVTGGNSSNMVDRFELVFSPNSVTGVTKQINGINFGLYPNPTKGNNVNMILAGLNDAEGSVVILDVLGKEVFRSNVSLNKDGVTSKTLDINLASGMYSVKFVTKSQTLTEKLIVR